MSDEKIAALIAEVQAVIAEDDLSADNALWRRVLAAHEASVQAPRLDPKDIERVLVSAHFDGRGCGTNGSNACSNCHGPSPLDAREVAALIAGAVQAPERTLEVGYTAAELVSAVEETRRYLTVEHPGRGCIGCDKCARISLLDITAAGIEELASVQAPVPTPDATPYVHRTIPDYRTSKPSLFDKKNWEYAPRESLPRPAVQAPAVDREALIDAIGATVPDWTTVDGGFGLNIPVLADALIESGILQDAREFEARGLEKAADDIEPLGYGATVTNILRMRACAVREARND